MLKIQPICDADYQQWLVYWQDYQEFYQTQLTNDITELTWQRFLDDRELMYCIVAKIDEKVIGFVTYILHRSTWGKDYYCYLEDLFVDQNFRGKKIAQQLIRYVQQQAILTKCSRLYWHTHKDNKLAQALYDRVAYQSGMLEYRMLLS